jgi:hypothetical protein
MQDEPTVWDVEKGLAKSQFSYQDSSHWFDGLPPRHGKAGQKVYIRYVWIERDHADR